MNKLLPRDLQKFIRKNAIKKIVLFLACTVVLSLALLFFGKVILHTDNTVYLWGIWLLGVCLLALFLKLHTLVGDKTFCGTIAKTIVKTVDDKALTIGLGSMRQRHIVDLIVSSIDGKTYYKSVSSFEDKAEVRNSLDKYKEGDAVFHLSGTPYTILLPAESERHVQCAVCGRTNDIAHSTCEKCGHTLIKSFLQ